MPSAVAAPGRDTYTLFATSIKPARAGTLALFATSLKKTMSKGVSKSAVAALDAMDAIRTLMKA